MTRISRDDLFMNQAFLMSKRSTCVKKQVGCVLVRDRRAIASGYNGVAPGMDHEDQFDDDGNTTTIHAEANMFSFCAKHGIRTDRTVLYVTLQPCLRCAQLIVQSGIRTVYYEEPYRCSDGLNYLRMNDIRIIPYTRREKLIA